MQRVTRVYVDTLIAPKCFIEKLDTVLIKLIPVIENEAQEVWLFGSVARGEPNAMSDLDIVVVGDWNSQEQRRAVSLEIEKADLREDVGVIPVDIIVRTRKFLESNEIFCNCVRRDKKILWRKDDGV